MESSHYDRFNRLRAWLFRIDEAFLVSVISVMRAIRQIKSLSISETRWLAYATAGVASALGLSPSAEAEIHYSGLLNIGMEHYNSVFLPLTNGASLNFTIFYRSYPYAYFRITGAGRASALAAYTFVYARVLQRLGKGDSIGSCDNCTNPRHFGSVAGMPGRGGIMGLYITGIFMVRPAA